MEAGSRFPNATIVDGKQLKELTSWSLHPGNNLSTQPTIYANLATQVKYEFTRLAREVLYQVQHFVSEKTGVLDCAGLKIYLEPMKITYEDCDRIRTV